MVAALNAPKDDRFQIITEHPVGDFVSEAALAGRDSQRCSACVCDSIIRPRFSSFSEVTSSPSFFFSAPAMAPRTVCGCKPWMISSMVAPLDGAA